MGKVSLHVDAYDSIDGFYSDRIWLAAGAGACNVRRYTAGQRSLPGYSYADIPQMINLVRRLGFEADLRKQVGQTSRTRTMLHDTYESRCSELLKHEKLVDLLNNRLCLV